ncbi:MAG: penicillin-binding protein 2 [Fimbriimonadaceae bacterium]|nr:penicillin-binding protein 2 [Fimbriimonadaceae bacterium]QYK55414.1 MAG: penicillin-binding protein 2 [Fimbriimonadaceae bacterium]
MIRAPEERPVTLRDFVFLGVVLAAVVAFLVRLWYLQFVQSDELRVRGENSSEASVSRLAPRGRILDRKGRVIAGVRPEVVVTAKPSIALKHPEVIQEVAARLGIDPKRLKREIEEHARVGELPAPVHVGADLQVAAWLAENAYRLQGFGVETQPVRNYVAPLELAHSLGYVRQPRDVDVERLEKQGIQPAAYVGLAGLERQYEAELMGTAGRERVIVDARRRPLRELGVDHPIPGDDLVLGIDLDLQKYALQLLGGYRGSVVAIDPSDGTVLCLASNPTYDASKFLGGLSQDEYSALRDDPARPLFPRAYAAAYAPGSTFKLVTTIAGIEAGVFSPSRPAFCSGYYQVGRKRFKCLGVHGSVSYHRALEKSCNAYFADLGVRAGPDALRKACDQVGIGRRTGIDIPGEATGTVATEEWWAKHRDRPYSTGDTVNFSVGQGELAVTPLQMACVAALVANNGESYQPHMVRSVVFPNTGETRKIDKFVLGKVDVSMQYWPLIKSAMVAAIESGTAQTARIPGLRWAGKTGSAENRKDHDTHSWFVGFAPLENPRIAICVMVENGGHGGTRAAPIAKGVVERFLNGAPSAPPQSIASR